MRRYLVIVAVLAFHSANAQVARVIKFDELESILKSESDDLLVINFWATWCGPCVKELPLFEALTAKNDPALKVFLINLDYADQIDKVNAFIARKKMKSEVLLLDETDYNAWIDRVDTSWAGAIPATLILNAKTGQRKFIAKEMANGELESYIEAVRAGL
ncbi:MAG: TlpA disulfide reductase family protein [Chryseolinea sp.]